MAKEDKISRIEKTKKHFYIILRNILDVSFILGGVGSPSPFRLVYREMENEGEGGEEEERRVEREGRGKVGRE